MPSDTNNGGDKLESDGAQSEGSQSKGSQSEGQNDSPAIGEVISRHLDRRAVLIGATAVTVAAAGALGWGASMWRRGRPTDVPKFANIPSFSEVPHGLDETHHVAEGYGVQVLLRWGDPLFADALVFDPHNQSADSQLRQFGYNNDFVAYLPLPQTSQDGTHGLLCVNHEFTTANLMFPDTGVEDIMFLSKEQVDVELAAHGHSVVEIKQGEDGWAVVVDSPYNRRISALDTVMRISGPAAGHPRLRTSADPSGRYVIGTLNNCAGGTTPWGTVLIAEENFHMYFSGEPGKGTDVESYERYGLGSPRYPAWAAHYDRFNMAVEPNEPNRFGWMVEIDPYDPESTPVKRTALGRFRHEGATTVINHDGRVVCYMGDDAQFEYVYKFVSHGRYDPQDPELESASALLDSGTLFVARFHEDGTLAWLPLVWGAAPLVPDNGFASQADVLIDTRRAADLLGATPMDRPEDMEPNPITGTVFLNLTNNTARGADQVDAANPRAKNKHGHILELLPPGEDGARDHGALTYTWEIFLLAGDPSAPADGAQYHAGVSADGWLSSPDNFAFDSKGGMWIATDGMPSLGIADGAYASDVRGDKRALTRQFFRCPRGAELCGPAWTPDDGTFFAAVQHPGLEMGSTFDEPTTRWPDFSDDMPPRPAVVAITRRG